MSISTIRRWWRRNVCGAVFCDVHLYTELVPEGRRDFPKSIFENRVDIDGRVILTLSYRRVWWCPKCADFKTTTRIL